MTTLELLKAAMKDNKRIDLMKTKDDAQLRIRIYNYVCEEQIEIHTMFSCSIRVNGEYKASFLETTRYGKTEEQLFQTVADLYDGTVENFLEKVK